MILSFGLLGPGKGYESAIAAMPAVSRAFPSALYVVLGATHPDLLAHEGEAYRRRLEATAEALGVTDHVRFVDRFVGRTELGTWLEAADIFVTPYPNLDQIVSGTLSYAMGAGKAVVSTPVRLRPRAPRRRPREARRRPARRRRSPTPSWSCSANREEREAIGRRAYAYSRGMTWPAVGAEYRRDLRRGRSDGPSPAPPPGCEPRGRSVAERPLYPVSRAHLDRHHGPARDLAARGRAGPGPRVRVLHGRRRAGAARRPRTCPGARLGRGGGQRLALAAVPGRGVRPGGTALPELPRRGQGLVPERSLRGQPGARAADAGHRAGAGRRSAPRQPGA